MFKLGAFFTFVAASLWIAVDSLPGFFSEPVRVVFDLPEIVECRDVTPVEFARTHPTVKVIEAKFRVSARLVAGSESDVEDFLYVIASGDQQMRFQDYLPNTSLESSVAENEIEITDTTENAKGGEIGTHVAYQGVGGGVSRTKNSKHTHADHYKEIAPQALVVASGTTDHEHGVFFKLKPSRAASLEGAKEFTFLATVPISWRGGWCTVSCAARGKSKALFSRSGVVPAGVAQSQVGLYLLGDAEANRLAEELGAVQRRHADVLAGHLEKNGFLDMMYDAASTGRTASLCGVFKISPAHWGFDTGEDELDEAQHDLLSVQQRLEELSE